MAKIDGRFFDALKPRDLCATNLPCPQVTMAKLDGRFFLAKEWHVEQEPGA